MIFGDREKVTLKQQDQKLGPFVMVEWRENVFKIKIRILLRENFLNIGII